MRKIRTQINLQLTCKILLEFDFNSSLLLKYGPIVFIRTFKKCSYLKLGQLQVNYARWTERLPAHFWELNQGSCWAEAMTGQIL